MDIISRINEYLSNYHYNDNFFQLYSFTTENINGYMPHFDLKDKSLLTTGSSCDQAINASLLGCNDITVCDICPLTKYFYFLKLSALLVLKRQEFLNFLSMKINYIEYNKAFLDKSMFDRIKNTMKSLDYESYYIWEHIFNNYDKNDIEKLFRKDINILESIVYCNKYLMNDHNYNLAKKEIMNANIIFINDDITKLNINRTFDNEWLSNVPHYLDDSQIENMFNNCNRLLNDNGKILLCYFWNPSMTIKGFPIKYLSSIDFEKILIPGISKTDGDNSILIYTKHKQE